MKVRHAVDVQELISEWVEKDRKERNITGREHLLDGSDLDSDDFNDDIHDM